MRNWCAAAPACWFYGFVVGLLDLRINTGTQTSDLCPNCGHRTSLTLQQAELLWPTYTTNVAPPLLAYVLQHVFRCTYCGRSVLVWFFYDDSDTQFRPYREARIVWPERAPRELPEQAPGAMRSLYREASRAENVGALRGAGALYRAAVEELVASQQAEGRDLYQRIEGLAARGVDQDIVTDLHEARLLGNWSLHEGVEFSAEEVADVADLIADAVEILYVQPARRDAMREARAARREGRNAEAEE